MARIPGNVADNGQLVLFNSLDSTQWNQKCLKAGEDGMRLLAWAASFKGSRLPTNWDIALRDYEPQTNFDDCGVFVAACAASVVMQTQAPTHVKGFQAIMASQFVARVKGEGLMWDLVKEYLGSQEGGERGRIVESLEDEEMAVPMSGRLLCEWPRCPYETDDETV